jgi:pyruvate,water dikinase
VLRVGRSATVVDLAAPLATDASVVGSKAAALAVARRVGLPVAAGFVIPSCVQEDELASPAIRSSWEAISDGGELSLVVRSSSTAEDTATSSMAGRFRSVLDVRGWDPFVEAVLAVRASARLDDGPGEPMAVLVQQQVEAATGGVLFGVDPVTGDRRHLVVEAVTGGPSALVSGSTTATRYVLRRRRGRPVHRDGPALLRRRQLARLARLAHRADLAFGGPQDIEWAFDGRGRLALLQSRPITAMGAAAPSGAPLLGPGPVAETFPDPLHRLEEELWVEPLRHGVARAVRILHGTPVRRIARSPVIAVVGGRAAADLELLGLAPQGRSFLRALDPRPAARHLAAAWHIGRLRRELPVLAARVVARVDRQLSETPALSSLSDRDLLRLIGNVRRTLVSVHGYEVVAGSVCTNDWGGATAAALALDAIASGRAQGRKDAEIVASAPEVLAVIPPSVPSRSDLPGEVGAAGDGARHPLGPREALRLRSRWLQELAGRAATELGRRLAGTGRVDAPAAVRDLSLAELSDVVAGGRLPADLDHRAEQLDVAPLPAAFRLTSDGEVVPEAASSVSGLGGRGAGGGRRVGRVHQLTDGAPPDAGDILVVRVLEPRLAAVLPRPGGLVAETGSTLSHLAILARESHVPTVVAVPDALGRFTSGTLVLVDGRTGEVRSVEGEVAS